MTEAPTITVRSLNITVPLAPVFIPREVARGAGDVTWYIDLQGRQFGVAAALNGRNYRRTLAALDANGGGLEVVLQGALRSVRGTRFLELGCAGFRIAPATTEPPLSTRAFVTVLGTATEPRDPRRGPASARVCFDWLAASISLDPVAVRGLGDGVGCRLRLDGWSEEIGVQFLDGECQRTAATLNHGGIGAVVLRGKLSAQVNGALQLTSATLALRPEIGSSSQEEIPMAAPPSEQPTAERETSPEETRAARQLDAPEAPAPVTAPAAGTVGWTRVVNINTASATLRDARACVNSSADMPAHGEALAHPEPRATIVAPATATSESRQVEASEAPRREPQSTRSTSKGDEPPAQGTSTLRARAMPAPSAAQLRPPAVQQAVKDEEKHMPEAEAIEAVLRPLIEEFTMQVVAAVSQHLRERVAAEVQAVVQRAFSDSTSASPALTAPVSTPGEKVSAIKAVAPNECSEPGCHGAWYRPGGKDSKRCYQHFRQAGGLPPPGKKPGTGKRTHPRAAPHRGSAERTVEATRATKAPAPKGADQSLAAKIVVGQSVQYRQGRGTFQARVTAVDATTGTVLLTRLSDGKEVMRPAGKIVTTAAELPSPPVKPEPKRSATPPKIRRARAAKDAGADAATGDPAHAAPEAGTLAKPAASA